MRSLDVVSADGVSLDTALHPAKTEPIGTVIQAHGITVDKDEGGMFVRLAETLSCRGFNVIRFSYRGHGKSGGTPLGVTVTGEIVDLGRSSNALWRGGPNRSPSWLRASEPFPPHSCFPCSEPASTLSCCGTRARPGTHFPEPGVALGMENFGPEQQRELDTSGCLWIDGEFPISPIMWREFSLYDPFSASRLPGFPHSWCTETRTPTCPTASRRPRFLPKRCGLPHHPRIDHGLIRPSGRMRPSECRRIGSRLERSGPDGSEELAWAGQGRRGLVRHRHQHTSHRDVGVVAQTLRTSTPIRHISEDRPQTTVVSEFQWSRLSTSGGLSSPIPGN